MRAYEFLSERPIEEGASSAETQYNSELGCMLGLIGANATIDELIKGDYNKFLINPNDLVAHAKNGKAKLYNEKTMKNWIARGAAIKNNFPEGALTGKVGWDGVGQGNFGDVADVVFEDGTHSGISIKDTTGITLFKEGLIQAKPGKMHPNFVQDIEEKLEKGWSEIDTNERTHKAIGFVANFIPSFETAEVAGPPLYGAQQIPGSDPSLRVGEVSFPMPFYARSEIIKASSALTVANQIIDKMHEERIIEFEENGLAENPLLSQTNKIEIDKLAEKFAVMRGYPAPIAQLVAERHDGVLV